MFSMHASVAMGKSRIVLHLLVLFTCLLPDVWSESLRQNRTWPYRTYPGNLEFPTHTDLQYFGTFLDGELITFFNSSFLNVSQPYYLRVWRLPAIIVKSKSVTDIQRSILFARKRNLHLTVWSSGHDAIGRSSHDGSLNLNLESMNEIEVKLDSTRNQAGEVKVQTGATWEEVYKAIDKVRGPDETGQKTTGRVIVGPIGRTVAMGGYTQGGGYSWLARKFGLAADNVLEATIVTPDAKVHIINESMTVTRDLNGTITVSNDTSLFWAIRGGGGGTWGVVVDFTFKLHYAPERFRRILAKIPALDKSGKSINTDAIDLIMKEVAKLSPDWSGTFIVYVGSEIKKYDLMELHLNHYGTNSSSSNQEVEQLLKYKWAKLEDTYHPTFLDYLATFPGVPKESSYIFNTFIQRAFIENESSRADFVKLMADILEANMLCHGTLIGGKMTNVSTSSTPIHPGFRAGLMTLTCGVNREVRSDNTAIETALKFARRLYRFGQGSYINLPAEDMPDWKMRFWGGEETYERLLNIKKKVDPNNYLYCHNCVGSDLGTDYITLYSTGLPGQPIKTYFETSLEFDQL